MLVARACLRCDPDGKGPLCPGAWGLASSDMEAPQDRVS